MYHFFTPGRIMDANQQKIGKYDIVAPLGKGAMGVVYKAFDPMIKRFVALKTIHLGFTEPPDDDIAQRFHREAQAAGNLNHQIEHHLFPTLARNKLREAREVVKDFCQQYNIEYYETTMLGSYAEILQHLHEVSAPLRRGQSATLTQ